MKLKRIFKNEEQGPSYFVVDWMLHDRCTYDCSYCPPANKSGTDSWLKLDVVTQFCEELEKHVARVAPKSKIHCLFTGGEPTVWKDFTALIDVLSARGWYLSVNSNGSRTARWWEENAHKFSSITLSYHTESVDDEEFVQKVKICESKTKTSVNIMLHPNLIWFRKAVRMGERLKNETTDTGVNHFQIQHNFGLQVINISQYSPEQLSVIPTLENRSPIKSKDIIHDNYYIENTEGQSKKCNGLEIINAGLANFKGWNCHAGLDGVFIDAKGELLRGTCRVDGKFGNILDPKSIQWPSMPVTCPYKWCGCITDILNTKEAP